MTSVAKWDIFELELAGPSDGNPYLDVRLEASFTQGDRSVRVPGFHDGGSTYRIRFIRAVHGRVRGSTHGPA